MIPVGATVYLAPGVEKVKYLSDRIKEDKLLLGSYMMGKITRYTNNQDKVGIEFEYRIWRQSDSPGPSNHETGKPGFCCYVPVEYVKSINEHKIDWFRTNIATIVYDNRYLAFKTISPDHKLQVSKIGTNWPTQATLGTDGYPELPESSYYPFDLAKNNFVREVTNNSFGSDLDVDKKMFTPSWLGYENAEKSLWYNEYNKNKDASDIISQARKAALDPWTKESIDYYQRRGRQKHLDYERQYTQAPQFRLGYDPYKAGGFDKNSYGLFIGARQAGKTQAHNKFMAAYYGSEFSKKSMDDRIMAMYIEQQLWIAGTSFSFTHSPYEEEYELLLTF